jgi:outer membrane murein-binding lipoprotein Lpp
MERNVQDLHSKISQLEANVKAAAQEKKEMEEELNQTRQVRINVIKMKRNKRKTKRA